MLSSELCSFHSSNKNISCFFPGEWLQVSQAHQDVALWRRLRSLVLSASQDKEKESPPRVRQWQPVHKGHWDCAQVCMHQEMLLTTRPLQTERSPSCCSTPCLLTRRNLPRGFNPGRNYLEIPTLAALPDDLFPLLCTYFRS